MLYTGQFRSLHRNKLYTVKIQTGNNSTPANGELTMGPEPFVTQMDGEADTIYVPVKYQSATVQIVNDEYLFSLFSSTAKQNSVKLLDASNNVVFSGYTSPNVWDADYNFEIETYEIEALDGLSILQYYDYEVIGQGKDFVTFAQIIDFCLRKAGCYTTWYWSKNTSIPGVSGNIPNLMTISEQCFFDEDDEPLKMNEVLEEVCKFCGVTAVGEGDKVYFIDYDAIKEDKKFYVKYTVGNDIATDSSVALKYNCNISSADYTSTGSSLSLKGTYSKVTVKDSLYAVESIIPSLFEDEDLENIAYESEANQNWTYTYGQKPEIQKKFFNFNYRSYRNKKYNHYYYDASNGNRYTSSEPLWFNGLQAQHYNGVGFFRYQVGEGETAQEAYDSLKFGEWDDYLVLSSNFKTYDELLLESKDEFSKPFFMSTDTKFIFKGSLIVSDMISYKKGSNTISVHWFPTTSIHSERYSFFTPGFGIPPKQLCMKFGLSLGNYSATGENSWASGTDSSIQVPFCERSLRNSTDDDDFIWEGYSGLFSGNRHEIFFNSFPICNNIEYNDKISDEGFMINCNSIGNDVVIAAKPKLKIYSPGVLLRNIYASGTTLVGASLIKDFDIIAKIPYEGGKDENDTDTEYSYVIDNEYINELSDIEFKICTYDGKQLNYSAVAYPNGSNYKFVDKLYNSALNLTERSENQMCYKIVNQYENPVKVLKLNLFDDFKPYSLVNEQVLDADFVIDCCNHDYRNDSVEITLVEKK